MAINIGIVGLPHVGKSTLFNALSAAGAESANFPFCTIEPNIGVVPVPDPRLAQLAAVAQSAKILSTSLEFVDIAGLVRGASKGEGLGNQFLGHIRQVDAIVHVVRCFDDDDVVHVDGSIEPVRDVEVVETELMLKDLETAEKRRDRTSKFVKAAGKPGEAARLETVYLDAFVAHLGAGKPARLIETDEGGSLLLRELCLLTAKPMLLVGNVPEAAAANPSSVPHFAALADYARAHDLPLLGISAGIEAEVAQLPEADRAAYLADLGLDAPGLHHVIRHGYALLGLDTFFTVGPQEARAWTVGRGTRAPQAAGVIHTDFERGFIRAEVMRWDDLVGLKSEAAVRQAGKLRVEGKEYVVQDGDVVHFRFNV